jgi:hypothetical protein
MGAPFLCALMFPTLERSLSVHLICICIFLINRNLLLDMVDELFSSWYCYSSFLFSSITSTRRGSGEFDVVFALCSAARHLVRAESLACSQLLSLSSSLLCCELFFCSRALSDRPDLHLSLSRIGWSELLVLRTPLLLYASFRFISHLYLSRYSAHRPLSPGVLSAASHFFCFVSFSSGSFPSASSSASGHCRDIRKNQSLIYGTTPFYDAGFSAL